MNLSTVWWFGTFFSIYRECHHPNWDELIFFRGVETTNQNILSCNGTVSHQSIKDNAIMCAAPSYTREVAHWYHLISRRCTYRCSCRNLPWTEMSNVKASAGVSPSRYTASGLSWDKSMCVHPSYRVRTTCKNPAKIQCWKIQKYAFQKINIDLENRAFVST